MKIYAVKIYPIDEQLFAQLLLCISDDEQERIKKFKKYDDALRGLTSKVLLRYIVSHLLEIQNNSICFGKNEYGKPYLMGVNDFHFNLSHSGDWVVCAVDSLPIGIDVERIHDVDLNLSKRFFAKEEHNYLESLDGYKRMEAFFELWTLKESYIKADGRGLAIPLNSFSFSFDEGNIQFKASDSSEKYYFKQYDIDPSYKLSVCARNTDFPEVITFLAFDELASLAKKYL
ncbi:4'-phosphopantetheinyl transferase family protein [Acetivibrio clariflavus]|uniref:Phosphopantetheine--protein transferase n=1 Tax=Acetivibrio clariflavus (strain DSM 19732 / NBRC 101661 / EBR45) TaxID=720554 RepID=G8LU21_ACECE|nr:4'-phosphopantetheinyl transferase superfamily protein [Acetivibrio clariflavus]AEV68409.1 phosphopantetheine--protein transferase [Acetivibrio clariflavus DSM 19732]